jgi:hypothetical protein
LTHPERYENMITPKGEIMFGIEKLSDGKILLNEYTENGIIKHEFDSHLGFEMWVLKRRIVFH